MPTDPTILAQLQALWQTAPANAVPVAATPPAEPAETLTAVLAGIDALPWLDAHERLVCEIVASLQDADLDYFFGPHRFPAPCAWCGGRTRHNPLCVALCDDWAVVMPFGRHKGKPVRNLDRDYLAWVLRSRANLDAELRQEIERVLEIGNQDA